MKYLKTFETNYIKGDYLILKGYGSKFVVELLNSESYKKGTLYYVKTLTTTREEKFYVKVEDVLKTITPEELNDINIEKTANKYNI